MKKFLLSGVALLMATPLMAQDANIIEGIDTELCPQFFDMDITDNLNRDLTTICRIDYAVIYDKGCKIPLMTFERLRPEDIDGDEPRKNSFKPDPSIPEEFSAALSDYKKSGFDRGHMVPSADMRESTASQEQTYYFTNIVPQNPRFNRVEWRKIEAETREFVNENIDTFIVTGAIVDYKNTKYIGNNVCIPDYMYKMSRSFDGERIRFNINKNQKNSTVTGIRQSDLMKLTGFTFKRKYQVE